MFVERVGTGMYIFIFDQLPKKYTKKPPRFELFLPDGGVAVIDPSPKRHRLAEVHRLFLPKGNFSLVTQSDLLAYGKPNVKPGRTSFLVKTKNLLSLAQAAFRAVSSGSVYSVYGQRVVELETSQESRWRIAIFSMSPGDVQKFFSHLSPFDVKFYSYSLPTTNVSGNKSDKIKSSRGQG
jgi:hypothetical protein